jgi:diguanylate cyclase (GGDEF)-like protein/PAS domain S-box-containing protein
VAVIFGGPQTVRDVLLDAAHPGLFRALHEIAVAIGSALDPAELGRIGVERALRLLNADTAEIYLWEPEHQRLLRLHSSDAPRPNVNWPTRQDVRGAAGQAVRLGRTVHVPDYVNWPEAEALVLASNVMATLAVPMRVDDRTIGALSVRFRTPHTCSPEQIETLTLLAAYVAPALEVARLRDQAHRQNSEREVAETLAEEALRASDRLTQEVIANAGEGIVVFDTALRYIVWNPFMEALTRQSAANVLGRRRSEIFPHLAGDAISGLIERALDGETVHSGDVEYLITSTGRRGWSSGTYTPRRNQHGAVVGVIHDITDRKHAEEALRSSQERFRSQYQGTPVPTFSWRQMDDDFELEDFNTAAEVLTRRAVHGWVGQRASHVYAHDPEVLRDFRTCAAERRTIRRGRPFEARTGDLTLQLDMTCVFVPPDLVMVHTEDITERTRAEANLWHRTLHDSLTGLPNRALLSDRLKQTLRTARREDTSFALLLLDLDRFKDVNDALGHRTGDALLRLMGRRLEGAIRGGDILARLGGDEFAVVLPDTDEAGARSMAARLLRALEEPFELNGTSLDVGGSLGVAGTGYSSLAYLKRLPVSELKIDRLQVEITESSLMADPHRARTVVGRLSALGVRIAIDDFGRSSVSDMRTDASDRAIVWSTIDLAHNLGLRVIAEGVEDAATWQLLIDLGCDEAQGYHLGRPAPPAALPAWVAQPHGA